HDLFIVILQQLSQLRLESRWQTGDQLCGLQSGSPSLHPILAHHAVENHPCAFEILVSTEPCEIRDDSGAHGVIGEIAALLDLLEGIDVVVLTEVEQRFCTYL